MMQFMMLKSKKGVVLLLALFTLMTSAQVLAVNVQGGIWEYGRVHNPLRWGAFSSYYHSSKWHWAKVASLSRPERNDKATGDAGYLARAFMTTNMGESAEFDFGFD